MIAVVAAGHCDYLSTDTEEQEDTAINYKYLLQKLEQNLMDMQQNIAHMKR